MRIDRTAVLSAAVVAALSQASVALSADKFWDGSVGNNLWTHGPNWFGGEPGTSDRARFDAASSVLHNHVALDQPRGVADMAIDGVPSVGEYHFLSVDDVQLFIGNQLMIAGIDANPTPVTFSDFNVDTGQLILGANGTLTLTGAANKLHAASGMEIYGRLNWQGGTVTSSFSTIAVDFGGSVNVTAGGRGLGNSMTLAITNGSFTSNEYFDIGSSFDAGNGPAGTLSVSGAGSSYSQTAGSAPFWGHNLGDNAQVTFQSGGTGTLSAGVVIAANGGVAHVNLLSGATLSVGSLMQIGPAPAGVASSGRSNAGNGSNNGSGNGSDRLAGTASANALINIDGGALIVNDSLFGASTSLQLASGTLQMNGNTTFSNGSSFNWSGGTTTIASGKTLTFDGGEGSITAGHRGLTDGATLKVINGGNVTSNNLFDVATTYLTTFGPTGALLVSGSGSEFSAPSSRLGTLNGDSGTMTFSSGAVGTFGFMAIAAEGGRGLLNVESGARLSVGSIIMGSGFGGGGTINVNGGTLAVSTGSLTIRPSSVVNYSAGSIGISGQLRTTSNSQVLLTAGGNKVLRAGGLIMSDTSKLDLNDNDMIIGALTSKASIENLVRTARNGGAWNGTVGITSTAAKNATPRSTTLGVLSGAEYSSVGGTGLFSGQPYVATDTLVKYTWYGDTDFNGTVNFDDYNRADQGFLNNRSGWLNGDFDFSGDVDFDDYGLIDLAFNNQSGTLRQAMSFLEGGGVGSDSMDGPALRMVEQHFAQFGQPYATAFLSAVPEPTAATIGATLGGLTLLRRRRRKS